MRTDTAATRDRYTVRGITIGRTLQEAAAWARDNADDFRTWMVMWERDDDAEVICVDSDINDLLAAAGEDDKSEVEVLREALQQLNAKVDRELLKLRIEFSLALESKEEK